MVLLINLKAVSTFEVYSDVNPEIRDFWLLKRPLYQETFTES